MARKQTTENLLVPHTAPDAIIEIPGEGLFLNTGEPFVASDEPAPAPVEATEPQLPLLDTPEEGN